MSIDELADLPLPEGGITVTYTSPGGIAVRPFADGYLAMRVCLGHVHHSADGLMTELETGRDPVPWRSAEVRDAAVGELRRRARTVEAEDRFVLARMVEHVLATPYYENN